MTRPTEHIEFEVLNDYLDGRLDPRGARSVEEHTAICGECSQELAALKALLADVAALPTSVLPEDDIWANLKTSIEKRKEVVLPVSSHGAATPLKTGGLGPGWRSRSMLAAAAVVLVVMSSGITAVVLRSGGGDMLPEKVAEGGAPLTPTDAPPVLPASFRVAEGKYMSTIEELREAFEAQRGQLSPETVRTVDRSLAVIDSAITEARTALLEDPGNRTLVDLLSASYQRKLDLLRRTSELTPRT